MAVSARDHMFLNNLLYVDNCKYHRSRFNANGNIQYWVCSEKKSKKCAGSAKTRFLLKCADSNSESESESETDTDPRFDLDRYKEILVSASSTEEHIQYHDVDPYEFKVQKFHMDLDRAVKVFFLVLEIISI